MLQPERSDAARMTTAEVVFMLRVNWLANICEGLSHDHLKLMFVNSIFGSYYITRKYEL